MHVLLIRRTVGAMYNTARVLVPTGLLLLLPPPPSSITSYRHAPLLLLFRYGMILVQRTTVNSAMPRSCLSGPFSNRGGTSGEC